LRLAQPFWLILLALAPVPWLLAWRRGRIAWPTLDGFHRVGWGGRLSSRVKGGVPFLLRGLAIGCVAVALARPQTVAGRTRIAGQGVAIVVALDQSSSMTRADFPAGPRQPPLTRLDAAKQTLTQFVAGRSDDLVGLVVFANYPDLACPPTLDHGFLVDTVRSVRSARPGDDGTNLGDAIVWSLAALRDAAPPKKVLILLTDGRNQPAVPRPTDPIEAARLARSLSVTLHTIAVGPAPTPGAAADPDGPDLPALDALAKAGGGRPFVAADANALGRVFAEIDALEKSPVRGEVRTRYREQYAPWAAAALGLLVLDRLLAAGRLRRLP
jgi:Ca-activated chloride channel family protein